MKLDLHSEQRDGERLSRVILNLCMSYVTSLRRTLTYRVFMYRLWLRSLIGKAQLEICPDIYEAQETLYLCS